MNEIKTSVELTQIAASHWHVIILLYHVFSLRIASGDERDRDAYRASDMHNESIECGVPCCVKWSGGGMQQGCVVECKSIIVLNSYIVIVSRKRVTR